MLNLNPQTAGHILSFIDVNSLISSHSNSFHCVELLEDRGQNSPHFAELGLRVRTYTSFFFCPREMFLSFMSGHKTSPWRRYNYGLGRNRNTSSPDQLWMIHLIWMKLPNKMRTNTPLTGWDLPRCWSQAHTTSRSEMCHKSC